MLEPSTVEFSDKDLSKLGKLIFVVFRLCRVIRVSERVIEDDHKDKSKGSNRIYISSNFTIINLYLIIMGPTREGVLTRNLMILQVFTNLIFFLTINFYQQQQKLESLDFFCC